MDEIKEILERVIQSLEASKASSEAAYISRIRDGFELEPFSANWSWSNIGMATRFANYNEPQKEMLDQAFELARAHCKKIGFNYSQK